MVELKITILNDVGLHARPAALFVKTATRFSSKIRVRNVSRGSDWVDAKSILRVLSLGVEKDHSIEVTAEGADEGEAINEIEQLVRSDFGEQK
jgi:phosphotransferase system HPr (HPr) family protein